MTSNAAPRQDDKPVPAEARCAQHGDRVAVRTCERCGNFMCQFCAGLNTGRLCPGCRDRLGAQATSEFAACPQCGVANATRVGATWWGGVLGPRLLNHVRCGACRTTYNGKTGRSNNGPIAIYAVVVNALVLLLYFGVRGCD